VLLKRFFFFTFFSLLCLCIQVQEHYSAAAEADRMEIVENIGDADSDLESEPSEPDHTFPGTATALEKESDVSECEDGFPSEDHIPFLSVHFSARLAFFRPGNFLENHTPPPKA
jgi:hypothetical protein